MVQVGTFKPPLFFFSFVGSFPPIDEARPLTADHGQDVFQLKKDRFPPALVITRGLDLVWY